MWMDLESVTQSEVTHKEKTKYHILTNNMESRNTVPMSLRAGWKLRRRLGSDLWMQQDGECELEVRTEVHTLARPNWRLGLMYIP